MEHPVALVLFWLCVFLLGYTYGLYPLLLRFLAPFSQERNPQQERENWPSVAVVLAAYNEETVLQAKMESVLGLNYPRDRISLWIGSDGSTDRTDELVSAMAAKGYPIHLLRFSGRNGKTAVLNRMMERIPPVEFLLLTDANILFEPDMLQELVRPFQNPRLGLLGAFVLHHQPGKEGIARQERQYILRENTLKYIEGQLWGASMGAFGAAYLIRRELFPVIPDNFFMEDFYISMHVLRAGFQVEMQPSAICREDLPQELTQEYRRKVRIAMGNVQNLLAWKGLLWPPSGAAFAFFSHKILRWLGPFLLMGAWLCSLVLRQHPLYLSLWCLQTLAFLSPLLDRTMQQAGIYIGPLRLIGYFYSMNFALLEGFIRYARGIQSSAWQPTERSNHD